MTAVAARPSYRLPGGRRDDEAILAVMMEHVTPDWYYSFDNDETGRKAWGIGTTGASEYARIRGELGFAIRFHPQCITVAECTRLNEKGIEATVVARDAVTAAEGIGYSFYPHYSGRGTNREREEFNDRVAVSVAKRNAILDLIPEHHITALLKVRTTVAEANKKRFEAERKQAQKVRMAAAPKVASQPVEMMSTESVDDPYGLEKETPAPESVPPTAPITQGSDS